MVSLATKMIHIEKCVGFKEAMCHLTYWHYMNDCCNCCHYQKVYMRSHNHSCFSKNVSLQELKYLPVLLSRLNHPKWARLSQLPESQRMCSYLQTQMPILLQMRNDRSEIMTEICVSTASKLFLRHVSEQDQKNFIHWQMARGSCRASPDVQH